MVFLLLQQSEIIIRNKNTYNGETVIERDDNRSDTAHWLFHYDGRESYSFLRGRFLRRPAGLVIMAASVYRCMTAWTISGYWKW